VLKRTEERLEAARILPVETRKWVHTATSVGYQKEMRVEAMHPSLITHPANRHVSVLNDKASAVVLRNLPHNTQGVLCVLLEEFVTCGRKPGHVALRSHNGVPWSKRTQSGQRVATDSNVNN
jgi:hypothetical protein